MSLNVRDYRLSNLVDETEKDTAPWNNILVIMFHYTSITTRSLRLQCFNCFAARKAQLPQQYLIRHEMDEPRHCTIEIKCTIDANLPYLSHIRWRCRIQCHPNIMFCESVFVESSSNAIDCANIILCEYNY